MASGGIDAVRVIRPEDIPLPQLTQAQVDAIVALWDATEDYASAVLCNDDLPEESATWEEAQRRLISARDMMGEAFPAGHPVYFEE